MDTNGKMDPNLIAGDASAPEHVVLTFFLRGTHNLSIMGWCLIRLPSCIVVVCLDLFSLH